MPEYRISEVGKLFGALEEGIAAREAKVGVDRLRLVLDVAAESGMDNALKRFGTDLSEEGIKALKSLTPEEIKTLNSVRAKIDKSNLVAANNGGIF